MVTIPSGVELHAVQKRRSPGRPLGAEPLG
jgi:hypothetical protein